LQWLLLKESLAAKTTQRNKKGTGRNPLNTEGLCLFTKCVWGSSSGSECHKDEFDAQPRCP